MRKCCNLVCKLCEIYGIEYSFLWIVRARHFWYLNAEFPTFFKRKRVFLPFLDIFILNFNIIVKIVSRCRYVEEEWWRCIKAVLPLVQCFHWAWSIWLIYFVNQIALNTAQHHQFTRFKCNFIHEICFKFFFLGKNWAENIGWAQLMQYRNWSELAFDVFTFTFHGFFIFDHFLYLQPKLGCW